MEKPNVFCKTLAMTVALVSALSLFSSCESRSEKNEDAKLLDISGYNIVRSENAKTKVKKKTSALKNAIEEKLGLVLSISEDRSSSDTSAKEILVGETNRKESADALAKLDGKEGDAYIVEITGNKIVIVGKTELSTMRGIDYFINNYVISSEKGKDLNISHGKSVTEDYSAVKNIWIADKLDMDVELVSTVFAVPNETTSDILGYPSRIAKTSYPSIIELKYQPKDENNGKLLANFHIGETPSVSGAPKSESCIMESSDGGENWKIIARPEETIDKTLKGVTMAHLFELPEKVGNLPAGTIILSGNSVDWSRKSIVGMWCSFDCGYTWEEYSVLDEGGTTWHGVWEPFMWYEESDGYLYCFYSDDTGTVYDQRIVYKRSKDGKNWEEKVNVCAFSDFRDRPGMVSMTKMNNGEYFIAYEYYGGDDGYIYYKTTKDITKWDASDIGTKVMTSEGHTIGSAPWCVWTPAGGECGTLFVTGRWEENGDGKNRIFVSFDHGKTWETVQNPLSFNELNDVGNYGEYGRSPCLIVGKDPSIVYYVNTTDVPKVGKQRIQFAKLKIYEQFTKENS